MRGAVVHNSVVLYYILILLLIYCSTQKVGNVDPSSDDGENEEPKRGVQLYTAV